MPTIRTSLALFLLPLPLAVGSITPEQAEFFEKKVRPVLAEQCYKCHGPEKQKGDLRLDSLAAVLKGADVGPVAIAGKPDESSLIKSIRHEGDSKMPGKGEKLPADQIAALEEWVKMGMPWPESSKPATPGASATTTKAHWAWQPVKNPAVPAVKDEGKWARTEVDRFILAKLEEKKVAPSPIASKRTLIRRATYDLTGLPPTAAETDAFEKDNSPEAYSKLIDRLLASPRYGERWGRYWLDVARYSDTKGYLAGGEERRYPFAYTYRDWVINALNRDLPYDQFIIQQIAGDQVATEADTTPMAAQGFITLGRRFLNSQPDIIDDRIDVVSRGLMGLSVTCARCHDHKFDPIPTKDYYALYGVFGSSIEKPSNEQPVLTGGGRDAKDEAEYRKQLAEREGEVEKYVQEKDDLFAWRMLMTIGSPALLPKQPRNPLLLDRAGKEALTKIRNKIDDLNAGPLAPPRAMAMYDAPTPMNPHVFVRGNPGRPGEKVPRRFLTILSTGEPKPFAKGSGRLELAQAIASKDNPLTARVMVNRVWNLHFGRGIVRTPGDFGVKGDAPTHPELLDWLATRFMADGWSLKKLHRTMMLTSAYQQTSDDRPDASLADPENLLVWKMNRRRLDFEAMRDSLLASAGELDLKMGGRGVELAAPDYATRRAVYGYIDRQNLPGVFRTFDFASPDQSSPQRFVTTVPQQALFMMNSPFVMQRAKALVAAAPYQEANAYEEQLQDLYRRVFARKAENSEVDAGLRFVMNGITNPAPPEEKKAIWQYGWGGYDEAAKRVDFNKFSTFNGQNKTWQSVPKLPDPKLGFANVGGDGGHPGRGPAGSSIRRWTAPRDLVININGTLARPADAGDGVTGRIVSSRTGELLKMEVKPKQIVPTKVERVEVKAGDTIDFIVESGATDNSDAYKWTPTIGSNDGTWDAKGQFAGPPPARVPLKPWEQYAQVLLQTNEFAFVD